MVPFTMSSAGELHFGPGAAKEIPSLLAGRNWRSIALVISRGALADPDTNRGLRSGFDEAGISVRVYRYDRVPGNEDPWTAPRGTYREASPEVVDAIVARERGGARGLPPNAVVAIGGGSAVDTGKAVSVALRHPQPIAEYLEGIGTARLSAEKAPFVAVPTTAGTGSEATKNAVLSRVGIAGYKKSLRHDRYIPDVAVIDPLLQTRCPAAVTAASGMDAIAQLFEAYISTGANALTDALALEGLRAAGRYYARAVERGETDVDARGGMAYAAYLSGRCLANAGLGVVHGLAGPAGAHTPVPHGVVCGALLPHSVDLMVERLRRHPDADDTIGKFAQAGAALSGRSPSSVDAGVDLLVNRLREFSRIARLPGLREFGFTQEVIERVADEGNSKSSPVPFDQAERTDLLSRCV